MNGRAGLVERLLAQTRAMTFTNVLILALIAMVALPSYGAYRFVTDEGFRREFLVRADLVDVKIPCLVLRTSGPGRATRFTVGVLWGYDPARRMEWLTGLRSAGELSGTEMTTVCQEVLARAKEHEAADHANKEVPPI
jgi:hypothetical protein